MSSDHLLVPFKVAVRIRSLIETEKNRKCQSIVKKTPAQPQVVVNCDDKTTKILSCNYVFAPEDTQKMIYENAIKSMVMKIFSGYNATILAYGQTGSGKTHTMGTIFDGNLTDETGIIPRVIGEIFEKIAEMTDDDFTVQCSFVELYQEKLYDLLLKKSREQSVVDSKIAIPNVTEASVKTIKEAFDCLKEGSKKRKVGATVMNAQSSRSHAIFTIIVQKTAKDNSATATITKFQFVDLAGSGQLNKTQTDGEQFDEGVEINKSLSALGTVMSALGSAKQGNGHIPYRDGKLPWLLKDSLGGNAIALWIACVSPADLNRFATLATLDYVDRAKKIKNKLIVNENRLKSWLNEEIELLTSMVDIKQSYDRSNEARAERTSDLRGKINANVINTQIKMITDCCQSLSESCSLGKMLLNHIIERHTNSKQAIDEKNKQIEELSTQMEEQRQRHTNSKQAIDEKNKQIEELSTQMEEQRQQYERKLEESRNESEASEEFGNLQQRSPRNGGIFLDPNEAANRGDGRDRSRGQSRSRSPRKSHCDCLEKNACTTKCGCRVHGRECNEKCACASYEEAICKNKLGNAQRNIGNKKNNGLRERPLNLHPR